MKRIKTYKLFLEEVDFNPKVTDAPDLKMAKEKLSTIKQQLSDYKAKKIKIDKAYVDSSSDADLTAKIDEIVGKEEEERNPFLVEYLSVANLKRKISKMQKDISEDKIKADDFKEQEGLATEDSLKGELASKTKEVSDRIKTNSASIASMTQEIANAEKKLNTKMISLEKEMMDYIKKIDTQAGK